MKRDSRVTVVFRQLAPQDTVVVAVAGDGGGGMGEPVLDHCMQAGLHYFKTLQGENVQIQVESCSSLKSFEATQWVTFEFNTIDYICLNN